MEDKENHCSSSEDEVCAGSSTPPPQRETGDGQMREQGEEQAEEKALDHDQDKRNPQYIPKGGSFYEHDNRTLVEINNEVKQEIEKKKKVAVSVKKDQRWLHDLYSENDQGPKSAQELIDSYGYDIRQEDKPPRARRNKKYSRGQEKYERSWQDEEAYQNRSGSSFNNNQGRQIDRQDGIHNNSYKQGGNKEFSSPNESIGPSLDQSFAGNNRKKTFFKNHKVYENARSPSSGSCDHHHSSLPGFHSGWIKEDKIKPFRNDTPTTSSIHKNEIMTNINETVETNTPKSDSQDDSEICQLTENLGDITINRSQVPGLDDSNLSSNRKNPKRYSNISKGFVFPLEDIAEFPFPDVKGDDIKYEFLVADDGRGERRRMPANEPNVLPFTRNFANVPHDGVEEESAKDKTGETVGKPPTTSNTKRIQPAADGKSTVNIAPNVIGNFPAPFTGNAPYISTPPIIPPPQTISTPIIDQSLSPSMSGGEIASGTFPAPLSQPLPLYYNNTMIPPPYTNICSFPPQVCTLDTVDSQKLVTKPINNNKQ